MAELAKRRLRSKIPALTEALTGRFRAHHAFLARVHLDLIDRQTEARSPVVAIEAWWSQPRWSGRARLKRRADPANVTCVFHWREQVPVAAGRGVDWGFTSARGGSSAGDFASLNLGGHVGDDPQAVESNRTLVAEAFGVGRDRLLFMSQRHGSDVVVVDGPWQGEPLRADGLVTTSTHLVLAVLVADCTPVLLVDRVAGVAAAVHAGRPGMMSGIVGRAVDAMTDLGARSITAAVGPSVCGRCYEVPEAMRTQAAKISPVAAAVSWQGTPAIDVAAAVVDQLRARSVAVQWIAGCSRESEELFSYRRRRRTGRFAGVVRLLDAHTEEEHHTEGRG